MTIAFEQPAEGFLKIRVDGGFVIKIAWFVSPHGFGHAARSAAIMDEIFAVRPEVSFDVFTTVPEWFFDASLSVPFRHHPSLCDVGLVQRSALEEDIDQTLARLAQVDLLNTATVQSSADIIQRLGCQAVVADIAPQGLAAARVAGLPSILVENFTWDWIYRGYEADWPAIGGWADRFEAEFSQCDVRIQAEPWCRLVDGAVRVAPISRKPRTDRATIRRNLGITDDRPMVLVSMGGIPWDFSGLERVAGAQGVNIVVPGGGDAEGRTGSLIVLPHHSRFHHPDLVHAADGVVAKLGYSTVAEVWSAGCPLGWIGRPSFPESAKMAAWVRRQLEGAEISHAELTEGRWADRLSEIVNLTPPFDGREGGASAAAEAILAAVGG